MSFDPRDYDLDLVDAPPDWLSRFVREEVRPLLLQHRHAALEALDRWLACHEARKRELAAWEARQCEFLRELADLPEEGPRRGKEPPAEGLVWMQGYAVLGKGRSTRGGLVCGWGPRELSEYTGPAVELPPPPPSNRGLSPDECWAALLAVHDAARDRREWLGPADSIPFAVLRRSALDLTQAELPDLRALLRTTCASLPLNATGTMPVPASPPPALSSPAPQQEVPPQSEGGRGGSDSEVTAPVPALLSAPDLARWFRLGVARVESALRRLRDRHPDCVIDLGEVENLRSNEPRFLYRTAVVWPVLERLAEEG